MIPKSEEITPGHSDGRRVVGNAGDIKRMQDVHRQAQTLSDEYILLNLTKDGSSSFHLQKTRVAAAHQKLQDLIIELRWVEKV